MTKSLQWANRQLGYLTGLQFYCGDPQDLAREVECGLGTFLWELAELGRCPRKALATRATPGAMNHPSGVAPLAPERADPVDSYAGHLRGEVAKN